MRKTKDTRSATDIRVELGAAGTEAIFEMQAKCAELFNMAASKHTVIRRAVMLLAAHLHAVSEMTPDELQHEELLWLRLSK